jgi:hypothetical protein
MRIHSRHVTKTSGKNEYATDCGALGLPSGVIPARFETTLGNRQPLVFQGIKDDGNRIVYSQANGVKLVLHRD